MFLVCQIGTIKQSFPLSACFHCIALKRKREVLGQMSIINTWLDDRIQVNYEMSNGVVSIMLLSSC